jgi:hypothetical protein
MNNKKLISIMLVFMLGFLFFGPLNIANAGSEQKYGIVTINGKEMYMDKAGNVYPIIIFNSKKCIVWHKYDLVPISDVIRCESGISDKEVKYFIGEYRKNHTGSNTSSPIFEYFAGEKAGYNQVYYRWANDYLGNSNDTIRNAGCFLCSTASELLRYGLKDPVSCDNVDPVNLNEWLKDNEGFNGAELCFSAVEHFPGISYIIDGFDDFNGAARILYQSYPNAPIMCFRSQYPYTYTPRKEYYYHFCLYVEGDGNNPYYKENGLWKLKNDEAAYHEVIDSGFNKSYEEKGTVRNLAQIAQEGAEYHGSARYKYVRPDSGIFRVAFKG